MTTVEKTEVKLNGRVANKDATVVGKLTRVKKGMGYVMVDGAEAPVKVPMNELTAVKRGRTAKASAPADKGDTPAMPAHTTSDKPMTSKIQIIVRGTVRGPNWRHIARSFDNVGAAKEYLGEFQLIDVNGTTAKIKDPAEADVQTNYDIELIKKGTEPKSPMPVIIHLAPAEGRSLTLPKPQPTTTTASENVEGRGVAIKRTKKTAASSSGLIPLKSICRDISMDPREARVRLRADVKATNPVAKIAQGRWEWPADQVDDIKSFLQGGGVKGKAAKDVVAKKNEEEAKASATKVKPSKKAAPAKPTPKSSKKSAKSAPAKKGKK